MKLIFLILATLTTQNSFAAGPCETQARVIAESIERAMNPRVGRLNVRALTVMPSSTGVSNVKVQVVFSDHSTALYSITFRAIGNSCAGVSNLQRSYR